MADYGFHADDSYSSVDSSPSSSTTDPSECSTSLSHVDLTEPCLMKCNERLAPNYIQYPNLWAYYKKHVANLWTAEEIDLSADYEDWLNKLNDGERYFIEHILAFFATSDGIVNINLLERFLKEVCWLEARYFYTVQAMMENIHAETYTNLLMNCVRNSNRFEELLNAVKTMPTIKKKAEWAYKYIEGDQPFAQRLVAFAAVEGIFFSGSFCAIFWLKKRSLMPGLTKSNEFISRDEGMHTDFACELYNMLTHRLEPAAVQTIIRDAVDVEKDFITAALPVSLIGMNADLMKEYIEFVADRLCVALHVPKIYNSKNPFDFMDMIAYKSRTQFFEKRVAEYGKAKVRTGDEDDNSNLVDFSADADF